MKSHETRMVAAGLRREQRGRQADDPGRQLGQRRPSMPWSRPWSGPAAHCRWSRRCWCRRPGRTRWRCRRRTRICSATATASWSPGTVRRRWSPRDGRWVIAGMDRNGLRPLRYTRTSDGLLVVGSETGMVPLKEADDRREGPGRPGRDDRRRSRRPASSTATTSSRTTSPPQKPYGKWVREHPPPRGSGGGAQPESACQLERGELRRRRSTVCRSRTSS